jgi:hypothetical protein
MFVQAMSALEVGLMFDATRPGYGVFEDQGQEDIGTFSK